MARKKSFDEIDVLQKALQLFWRKGYNATSIQDLVDELGINRASLYDTWGDKHNLYVAALKLYRQSASSRLLNDIRSDMPARQVIESLLQRIVHEVTLDKEKKGCFVVNATTELANCDHDINQMVDENRNTIVEVLAEIIKEGQEKGEFKSQKSPHALARFIFNSISGLRVIGKGDIPLTEMKEVVDITISALD